MKMLWTWIRIRSLFECKGHNVAARWDHRIILIYRLHSVSPLDFHTHNIFLHIQSSVIKLKMAKSDSISVWHNDIIIHMGQVIGLFFHTSSQWVYYSTFNYLASACCSSCSALQKSYTFPYPTDWNHMGGLFHVLYVQQQYFLHAYNSTSVDVLAVTSPSIFSATAA